MSVNRLDEIILFWHSGSMTPEQIVKHYGGRERRVEVAATALGLSRQAVYVWLQKGAVPPLWQRFVELDTRGKLRAEKKQCR